MYPGRMANLKALKLLISTSLLSYTCLQACAQTQIRSLHLQEYQSKQLLADHGIAVQKFRVASNAAEALSLTKDLCESPGPRFP